MNESYTTLKSPRSTRETIVQETATDTQSKNVSMIDGSHEVDEAIPLLEPEKNKEDVGRQGGDSEKATTESDTEVRFVVPECQQTAEDFDLRQFLVDVDQLVVGLQAVVHRQAVKDFEGDRLEVMVSAVVGTMHNFKAFVSSVYDLLETVREKMKLATDFMTHKILEPTEWDYRSFKGQSRFVSFTLVSQSVSRTIKY